MSLFEVQLAALILLLSGTFLCGCLPILIFRVNLSCCTHRTPRSRDGITSFLIYFGGGVLFSTAMLHLLPEAQHQLTLSIPDNHIHGNGSAENSTKLENSEHEHGWPWAEFIVLCGFFATYMIDVFFHMILERRSVSSNGNHSVRTKFCSCSRRNIECSRTFKPDTRPPGSDKRKRSATWAGHSSPLEKSAQHGSPPDLLRSTIVSHHYPNYGALMATGSDIVVIPNRPRTHTISGRQVSSPPQLPRIPEVSNGDCAQPPISLVSVMTVAALSFHSVFEGFAIGFQKSVVGIWTLLLAVSVHKFVIAFVIGLEALIEGSQTSVIVCCILVFAIMSPTGMALAMSIDSIGQQTSGTVVGAVNCIASGTLLYVTFFEVFPRKNKGSCDSHRFWGTILGTVIMSALQYLTTVI